MIKQLMSLNTIEDITSSSLDFQVNIVCVTFYQKTTVIYPELDFTQDVTIQFILLSSKLPELFEKGEVY